MNLGYWKSKDVSYDEACKALADLVGREAALNASDEVLCVGGAAPESRRMICGVVDAWNDLIIGVLLHSGSGCITMVVHNPCLQAGQILFRWKMY